MKRPSAGFKIAVIVLLAGVVPGLIVVAAHLFLGDAPHVQEPVHELFELAGSCIALVVAALLLLHLQHDASSPYLLWVAAALVVMGLVDGAHSVLPFSLPWSWLRHSATLAGGAIFAMVWIPPPAAVVRHKQWFLLTAAVLAIAWSLGVVWRPELFPAPFLPEGFALPVKVANALGGLGFLAASVFFLRCYRHDRRAEDAVFAGHTLLFGAAGLAFGFAHVWAADWWVWHVFRLSAYAVVFVAACEMISALHRAIADRAQKVLAAEGLYRALVENIDFGVALIDEHHTIAMCNAQISRWFRKPVSELMGKPCFREFERRDAVCPHCPGVTAMATGLPARVETEGVRDDGSHFSALVHAFPLPGEGRTFRGFIEVVEEITEKKKAEAALQRYHDLLEEKALRSDEGFRFATDSAGIGTWCWDMVADTLVWSERCKAIFGLPPDEPMSYKRFLEALHPDDRERTDAAVRAALDRHEYYDVQYRSLWPDGSTYWIQAKGRGYYDVHGKAVRMDGVVIDIDEAKAASFELERRNIELRDAQEKLVRSEKLAAIGQLASSVAHELRNPLGAIKNVVYYLRMLELGTEGEEIKRNLEMISREVDNSDKIIRDLLEFARVKRPALRRENVNQLVAELVGKIEARPGVDVATELAPGLPEIEVDALQIHQVFSNLATNALQAMEQGGRLTIRTACDGDAVTVSFSDTGCGIPPEHLPKIFEPLFSTKAKGTGLGLAVCASIIDGHGGKILVESEVGRGTVMTVSLPGGRRA